MSTASAFPLSPLAPRATCPQSGCKSILQGFAWTIHTFLPTFIFRPLQPVNNSSFLRRWYFLRFLWIQWYRVLCCVLSFRFCLWYFCLDLTFRIFVLLFIQAAPQLFFRRLSSFTLPISGQFSAPRVTFLRRKIDSLGRTWTQLLAFYYRVFPCWLLSFLSTSKLQYSFNPQLPGWTSPHTESFFPRLQLSQWSDLCRCICWYLSLFCSRRQVVLTWWGRQTLPRRSTCAVCKCTVLCRLDTGPIRSQIPDAVRSRLTPIPAAFQKREALALCKLPASLSRLLSFLWPCRCVWKRPR